MPRATGTTCFEAEDLRLDVDVEEAMTRSVVEDLGDKDEDEEAEAEVGGFVFVYLHHNQYFF